MPTSTLASPPGNAFRFFHDADGRLKAAIDPEGDTAVYGWDAAGNLLSISRHASSKLSVIQMRPAKGDVGATVMIEGTGFSAIPASNTVKFNGTAATVSAATSTSLTTKVPVGATTGSVTVSTAEEGPVASPESFTVAESSAPHISTLSSSVAVAEEEITASGSNFEPMIAGNSLTLSLARPEMTSASASAIKFKVPTGTLGGRVSVATPEGSSAGPDLYIPPNGLATSKVGSTARFSLDETKSVSFAGSEKVTLVLFDGTAGQRVSLKLSESTLSSGVASLFSPVGDEVQGASFTSSGGGLVGPVTLPTTGTYTVLLSPSVAGSGSVKLSTYSFEDITGSISPPATAEGTQKSVSIATPGQEARYSVAGTAGEVVSLKTSSSAMSGEYSLEWLDPEGKVLKSWSSGGSENGFKGVVSFPATGTYTLAVNPKSWHTGSVTLTAWDASSATASLTPSASGDSKTMTISVPGQAALVTFSGTAGQRLSAVLSEITLSGGWTSLKRPTGKELEEGPISKGASKMYGPLTLPETGTYTITIVGSGENTGSVKVTGYAFEDVTGSISPPATAEGTQKSVSIATPGQEARYSVAGTTGEVVSLKRSSSAMSGSYQLEWLDPEGKVLKSWSSGGSENGFLGGVAFPSSGTYTLAVNPESTYTGSVTLTAWDATSASGSISPSGTGNSKTMTTTVPGQGALVTFAGTAGQQVSVDLSEITFSSGWASLKRPTGKELAEGSLSKGSTRTLGPVTLPETGTYTITIAPSGESTGSVKATGYLIENITGSISPSTSAEGSQQSLTIVAPGQEARYSVEIAAGEAVSLKTSSSTFNGRYYLEWINPSGKVVSSTSWKGSEGGYWLHQEFASAGTYTLAVNPEGSTTGSVTLTAWDASIYDAGSITPTAEGSSKVLSVNVPGGVTKIVFGGTSGQQLRFDFSEITFSGYMAIKTPAGSTLSGGETALPKGGSKSLKPGVLPSTGSYTIWFIPQFQNGETGSAKMTAVLESPVAWLSDPEPRMVLASFEGIAPRGPYPDGAGPRRAAYFHPELVSRSSHPSGMPSPADPRSRGHDRLRGRKSRRASGWRRNDRGNARLALHRGSTTLQRSGGSITRAMRQFSPGAVAVWHPPRNVPGWEAAEPKSPWAEMEDLQAPAGTTALAGQALERNGLPVAGVRVFVEGTSVEATTDEAGRFLLSGAPAGHQTLVINGESVPGDRRYGSYEVSVDLANHETTALDYTIWLSPLDSDGNRQIASPTEHETSLTTPSIPGLEVRIPAGTMIRNAAGKMVRDLNITAIPVNQAPFPLPPFVPIPVYFTIQPGRAYLSKGAQIVYPNWGDLRPGQRAEFWNYDPKDRGWYVYGRGTVSADGKQVVPDPGVRVWQFTGAMLASSPLPPEAGPTGVSSGDPVDLYSGLFTYHKRDLSLPDTLPIDVQRTYRPADSNSYSFGLGTTNQYDLRLWSGAGAAEANLIMPDGQRIHYVRTSPGTGYSDGVYKSTSTPGPFYASTLKYNPSGGGAYWNLSLTNGMTYVFGVGRLLEVRDSHGNKLVITRNGEDMTQITSPHGRWVKFSYDGSHRITEATDNGGRHVKYTYTSGRLTKVEGLGGRTTEYEYDGSGRMKAVINARGNKYLQNAYDANGRVEKQTMGDGGTFEFAYELDEAGKVKSTTVTDPRDSKRKVDFGAEGLPVSDTRALGTEFARTTTFERQPETGLILSKADALGRKTEFEYDSSGNVTEVTRLAGTEDAVTTKLAYEPGTSNVTEVTDPLGHTTELDYGEDGELLKLTDPLENETTLEYNGDGQPISITNPEEEETALSYEHGDLASITDPLGRTTSRFTDALGRVRSITAPGGQRTLLSYNDADELIAITSPSGATTQTGYDKDGDLISVTDPRENETTATYDAMDRLESETNPLEDTAEVSYDKAGNMIEAVSRNGEVLEFDYDPLGRLAKASFGVEGEVAESTIEYEYDDADRLIGVDDSASGEYVLDYDDLDRLTEVSGPKGTVGYVYDDAGRRELMLAPSVEASYEFDDANRLTEIASGGEAVSLEYDKASRLESLVLPNGIKQLTDYDKAGQVTSIAYKDGEEALGDLQYAYDANGRTEAIWGSYARLDLPTALGAGTYNAANQLTERGEEELSYDKDGNLIEDGAGQYQWDARGQLSSIDAATDASFSYDPFGRRVTKTFGETTTDLLYDDENVVQETVGKGTATVLAGLGPDQLFSRTTGEGTQSYLTDRLGSMIALADDSGEVDTTYSYEPFGESSETGEPSDSPFRFTGRDDDGTGLMYYRARYYSPATARFISPDPAGFGGGGPNLYEYVRGASLNFTDPTGENPWSIPVPNPVAIAEEGIKSVVSSAGEKAWGHRRETGAASVGGVCVVSGGAACLVTAGVVGAAAAADAAASNDCGSDFVAGGVAAGTTLVGALPGLPLAGLEAAGKISIGLSLPQRIGLNAPNEALSIGGTPIIEQGAKERLAGGSDATSSC